MNAECRKASASLAVGASSAIQPAAATANAATGARRAAGDAGSGTAGDRDPSAAIESHRNAAIDTSAARRCEPTAREAEAFRHSAFVGLYPPEMAGGEVLRWMRPRAALRLPPGGERTLGFSFPDPAARPRQLTVESEGRPIFSGAVPPQGLFLKFLAARERATVFRFAAQPSFRPSDSGAADSRLLSVRVAKAWP